MEISYQEATLHAGRSTAHPFLSALKKIWISDPGLMTQLLLTVPVILGGVALNLSALQWVLVGLVTFTFLLAGVFRTAALLQVKRETGLSSFQVSRIKCMGNAIVVVTAGISLLTYLLIFVPKITALL